MVLTPMNNKSKTPKNNFDRQLTELIAEMSKPPEPHYIEKWPLNFIPPLFHRLSKYQYY